MFSTSGKGIWNSWSSQRGFEAVRPERPGLGATAFTAWNLPHKIKQPLSLWAFHHDNKCLGQSAYTEERFPLLHNFWGFAWWSVGSIAFGPLVPQYRVARMCVGKAYLPHGIHGSGGPSSQYPPPGYALIDLTSFYLAPPRKGYPAHPQAPRLVTKPLNTHAFGGHSVKLQQPLSPGMVCMCAFQVTACQIPFLLRQ